MPNFPAPEPSHQTSGPRVSATLPVFGIVVQSGPVAARAALDQLLTWLAPIALDIEETGTIELVMAEVLNNIVEHAYPEESSGGPIHISCRQRANGLHFHIKDSGLKMPNGAAPVGQLKPCAVDIQDIPEGGFGWFLIHGLAKDVRYRRVGLENLLDLRIAIAHGPVI